VPKRKHSTSLVFRVLLRNISSAAAQLFRPAQGLTKLGFKNDTIVILAVWFVEREQKRCWWRISGICKIERLSSSISAKGLLYRLLLFRLLLLHLLSARRVSLLYFEV
jgi:cytochrome bd-type quinol oxidase subunit 1